MLIDKGDCKFMFEKENDIYTLPVLNNILSLDEIESKSLDKYSIAIDSHIIIEEAEDNIVVKAITKDKLNTKQYSHAVLNEILPNVSNENQIQTLSRIKNKIFL